MSISASTRRRPTPEETRKKPAPKAPRQPGVRGSRDAVAQKLVARSAPENDARNTIDLLVPWDYSV